MTGNSVVCDCETGRNDLTAMHSEDCAVSLMTAGFSKEKLAEHEADLLTVRYVAPPSGIMEALQGWAVEVRTKDGVTASGIFNGDVPHKGMFRINDVEDDHLILGTYLENVREVIVL